MKLYVVIVGDSLGDWFGEWTFIGPFVSSDVADEVASILRDRGFSAMYARINDPSGTSLCLGRSGWDGWDGKSIFVDGVVGQELGVRTTNMLSERLSGPVYTMVTPAEMYYAELLDDAFNADIWRPRYSPDATPKKSSKKTSGRKISCKGVSGKRASQKRTAK